ncbi:MAG: hypothetical protein RL660_2765 [Bacteroidota bacterium]|jgi:hypothetical protein
MTKSIKLLVLPLLLAGNVALSQNTTSTARTWGLEAELVQPFLPTVNILRINATKAATFKNKKVKGDILLGMYIRPNVKHDVVEKINEYMVVGGYRQYFWKGLNAEAKLNAGYAWGTKNLFDGKDYETATLFWESNLGYKFMFANNTRYNLYAIPQFGMIGNARGNNTVNIGPRGGKPDTFIQGGLLVGVNF